MAFDGITVAALAQEFKNKLLSEDIIPIFFVYTLEAIL